MYWSFGILYSAQVRPMRATPMVGKMARVVLHYRDGLELNSSNRIYTGHLFKYSTTSSLHCTYIATLDQLECPVQYPISVAHSLQSVLSSFVFFSVLNAIASNSYISGQ